MSPTPEYALLLDAVVPLQSPRADLRRWGAAEWGQTLHVAEWHRLSPALHAHLVTRDGVPEAVRHGLERAFLANAARNLFIRDALHRALDALDSAGVPAMPLKGAALIEAVYADPAQREMLDIDILVPTDRIADAGAALTPLGYTPAADDSPAGTTMVAATPGAVPHHDAPLVGDAGLLAIELHRHITIDGEGRSFEIEGFWQRAQPMGMESRLFCSPEDLLLHVTTHFTRNRLGGSYRRRNTGGALAQIADIAELVAHRPPDWDRLAEISAGYGLTTRVFLGLFAARTLGVPVPRDALEAMAPAGFDPRLGERLVTLRVLRAGDHLPPRSLRWMLAPSREVLSNGWNANPAATLSLARAYMRRARAHVPEARSAARRPRQLIQDLRLNDQIHALEK